MPQTPEERLKKILEAMQRFEWNPPGKPMPFKILLAGDLNSGKSTLRPKLAKLYGFHEIYTGGVMREMAAEKGLDILTFFAQMDAETEKSIDRRQIQKMLETPQIVFEGRIAPWIEVVAPILGLNLDSLESAITVRVYLAVLPEEGARRAMNRPENIGKSIEQIVAETKARIEEERRHYRELYGLTDHMDKSHFDVVVDGTSLTPEEVFERVIFEIAEWTKRNFLKQFSKQKPH